MQKKITGIITFSGNRDHTSHLFEKLSILSVEKVNDEAALALFTFRYLNGMLPEHLKVFSRLNKEFHSYNTTLSSKIHNASGRTNYKIYSTKYKGSQIWNNLPVYIINSRPVIVFKKRIKKVSKYTS